MTDPKLKPDRGACGYCGGAVGHSEPVDHFGDWIAHRDRRRCIEETRRQSPPLDVEAAAKECSKIARYFVLQNHGTEPLKRSMEIIEDNFRRILTEASEGDA